MKEVIIKKLKDNRPNLSESSLNTYSSTLSSLYKRVFGHKEFDINNFNKTKDILNDLKDKPFNARKSVLASLFVLTNNEKYKEPMIEDIKTYDINVSKQTMSEKEKAKFKSQDEIKNILKELKEQADSLYKLKVKTPKVIQEIQNYIIFCLTSGQIIIPRRLLDWTKMRCRNYDINDLTQNYYDGKQFIFNVYKGSVNKQQNKVICPPELKKILKKWLTVNESDFLLVDSNNNELNSVKLNQRLNKILGSGGVNLLRHSFLSTKFQDTLKQNELMAKTMEQMGSSIMQKDIYVQHLDK